jgi:hypothetical protein
MKISCLLSEGDATALPPKCGTFNAAAFVVSKVTNELAPDFHRNAGPQTTPTLAIPSRSELPPGGTLTRAGTQSGESDVFV